MSLVTPGLPVANAAQVARIKLMLDIDPSDTSRDLLLTLMYAGADSGIRSYLRRGSSSTVFAAWPELCSDTIFMTGQDRPDLIFPFQPLVSVQAIYLDVQGYGGQGQSGPFPASTLLTPGRDYMVANDDGQQSARATILRLGGINSGGIWGNYGWPSASGGAGIDGGGGLLAMGGRQLAGWPSFPQCLKIQATVGYATIPADLQAAVMELTIFLYNTRRTGGLGYTSENLGSYSYSYITNSKLPEIGTMRQQLARYRSDIPI